MNGNRLSRPIGRTLLTGIATLGLLAGSNGSTAVDARPIGIASAPVPTAPVSPQVFAAQLSPGWNLGNALESLGGGSLPATNSRETAYGNPAVTQKLLNAVAAAGFKSVRIPVSWAQYADRDDTIHAAWLARVAAVVGYARNAGLYVVVNVHFDGGWLQPTYARQASANARLMRFWTQIATKFQSADDHLLFAGTNEVMVTNVYSAPTAENCAVQNGFNQVFVNAVRATGGNNATRFLLVQGYNTNIDHTVACNAVLPSDSAAHRLMMEVHFYDPYDFTLGEKSKAWQWGAATTNAAATAGWGNEAQVDAQFEKMKTAFVDKGIPVVLGEYSAIAKTDHDPSGAYRSAWDRYVTRSAVRHGMIPMYWDNGATGNHGSGLFDRATAAIAYPATVAAIVSAAK